MQPQRAGANESEALGEFAELARSAGATVVGTLSARVEKPNPKYFIGTGKADELKASRESSGADLILVNHALSPVQERNLEKHTECRVVDRTGLILDIFAQRARSHEGKLQVELAQCKHMATRLVRGWTHLERQRGGAIGLRGPGETQLELDRRLLAQRVKQLTQRLEKVAVQRTTARRARQRKPLPLVSLVGYTNAGKSTLFNAITGAGVYAADKLFATLDPTLRRIEGLACGTFVLADTVGFIRDLPHDLIAAFKSTLAETRDADLLLHVVDASSTESDDRIEDVQRVLEEIGAADVPQILVYNKIDRIRAGVPAGLGHQTAGGISANNLVGQDQEAVIPDRTSGISANIPVGEDQEAVIPEEDLPLGENEAGVNRRRARIDSVDGGRVQRVWVSAVTGEGLDLLREAITRALQHDRVHRWVQVPESAGRLRARLFASGVVANERDAESGWELEIDAPRALLEPLFGLPGGEGDWLRAQFPDEPRGMVA